MRDRLPLPNRIKNAPTLHMGLELFYSAFIDLSSSRASGWGVGPIPWSAIADYAKAYEFDEDITADLFLYIRAMDTAYVQFYNKKAKSS